MNVNRLQRIDRWVGVPLCFFFTLLAKLLSRADSPGAPPRNLLFIKLAEQGSTVLAIPAIRKAIELVGRTNVYFVVFEDNRFILDALELIPSENVITVSQGSLPALFQTTLAAIKTLRGLRFDAAIDLEFFARGSAVLTYLSGAKKRIGFHPFYNSGPYRGGLMTHRLLYNPHLHTAETFYTMVEAVTRQAHELPTFPFTVPELAASAPSFSPQPGELERIQVMLSSLGEYSSLILLNPNASDLLPLRRWPKERYAQLARRIIEIVPDAAVVFTGGPIEAEQGVSLAKGVASRRCLSLAGKTSLRELLVLFKLADVLVTNDSGPAHFSALTPIRVVTLFGPETPALYRSLSPRNVPLWAGLVCSPCVNAFNNRQSPCTNNQCMQAISVDEVLGRVLEAIQAKSDKP